jgi:hemolysin activation/secretion protein
MNYFRIFGWLVLLGYVCGAQALTTTESEEQRQQDKRTAEERTQQQNAPDVRLPTPTITDEQLLGINLPEEAICFKVNHLELTLPDSASPQQKQHFNRFSFVQDDLTQYQGRCIGKEGINLLLKRLTAHIISKGYSTTRIGIPEQDLSSGTLNIVIVPGIIRTIRFADDTLRGTWKTAFPARPGDVLNLRDLEQGLEQMKRVASQDVNMQLEPGTLPGETDVVIAIKRSSPWKLTFSLDDSGTSNTGKRQAGINLALDNPLGLNDLFNIGFSADGDRQAGAHGTNGKNIYYSIPMGYWTFSAAGSQYEYHQVIAGNNQNFVSSGKSGNAELKIQRLFYRDQNQKLSLQFRTGKRSSHSYIDDTEIAVQRRKVSFAELAILDRIYIGQAQIDLSFAERRGVHWFGAQEDIANRQPDDPTYFYRLHTLDISLAWPFKLAGFPLKYTGVLHGQTTNSPLYAAEQISIGNRYTIRGFDGEQTLSAEKGYYWRNELETPLGNSGQAAYAAFDTGYLYGPNVANLAGDHLSGAALGLRGGKWGISYDVFTGWAVTKPSGFRTAVPAFGFSLSYQL